MKVLHILHAWTVHAYYARAHREIHPLHPDVLHVNLQRLHWRSRLKELMP